jgi:hypothetical protein
LGGMPFARGCGMAGLLNEGFERKIKHFAQPWKYAEREVAFQCEFQEWWKAVTDESRHLNNAGAP